MILWLRDGMIELGKFAVAVVNFRPARSDAWSAFLGVH